MGRATRGSPDWTQQGRESIDAVVLFGSLLSISVLGKGFFRDLLRDARRA